MHVKHAGKERIAKESVARMAAVDELVAGCEDQTALTAHAQHHP